MLTRIAWSLVLASLSIAGVVLVLALFARHHGPDPVITTKTTLSGIVQASEQFHIAYGSWPTGFSEFYPEHNSNHIAFLPSGPWSTNDAWGHPLIYKAFDLARGYGTVASLGRDAKPGGHGDDGDMEERFQ